MAQVNELVRQIELLQKQTNDAIVKKETAIAKKESILKDIEELKTKSREQFGCEIEMLANKKEEYSKDIEEKIVNLKKILGL